MSVASIRAKLTTDDIVRLMKGDTPEARASVANRLCRRMAHDALTEAERAHAIEIMGILAEDAAELVRRTMAHTLRNSPILPREIALKFARDVESVAIPVLEHSPAFTDDDLIEIVLASSVAKQAAIAGRETVAEKIADVIAEHGAEEAVEILSSNAGANWSDAAYEAAITRFPEQEVIKKSLVLRDHLPVHIAEKLVALVSGQVFDMLVNRHELPAQVAIDLAAGARERATLDLVEQAGRTADLPRFVSQLNLNGRLSQSLIVRSLCMGHMSFVEHALAELSGVPFQRVWLMIHDAGPLGLQAVFDRAGLPRKLLPLFRTAVSVFHETSYDGDAGDKQRFRSRMIERVLTQFQALPKDDLDYLLDKLDLYSAEAAEADRPTSDAA